LCVTLGENPLIRYHRPLDIQGTINRRIPERLAKMVQDELDNFCKVNPEFPVCIIMPTCLKKKKKERVISINLLIYSATKRSTIAKWYTYSIG
jgi:hypothetical protein